MNCIRYIRYMHLKSVRRHRKHYLDDKGVIRTLDYGKDFLAHEQRKLVRKGDYRRDIYG